MELQPRPLTIPLAIFASYFVAILNMTGFPNAVFSGGILWSGNLFGWPHEYMVTDLTEEQYAQVIRWRQNGGSGYIEAGTITLKSVVIQRFSLSELLFNLFVCLAAVLTLSAATEYWQRFFDRPQWFGLKSMFLLVALASIVAWVTRSFDIAVWYYVFRPWLQVAAIGTFILYGAGTAIFVAWRRFP